LIFNAKAQSRGDAKEKHIKAKISLLLKIFAPLR